MFPQKAKLTLEFTLRCAGEKLMRKVTIPYPKKLYQFELRSELAGMVVGFKAMSEVLQKQEDARRRSRPPRATVVRKICKMVRPRPSAKLKRR